MEHLKEERSSHKVSDLLKICVKMAASWSPQGLQTEVRDAIWAWGFSWSLTLKESQDILLTDAACRLDWREW